MDSQIHRLFFALVPDAGVIAQITHAADLARAAKGFRGQGIEASRYHMTLQFIGDFLTPPLAEIERAKIAVAKLKFVPFELALDRIESFRGDRPPCVLRTALASDAVLHAFWQKLYFALVGAGFSNKLDRGFTPHVTLGYGEQALQQPIRIEPILWRVREFVLIESLVGNSIHRDVARWSLAAQP